MTTLHLLQQQSAADRMVEVFYTDGKHDCEPEEYTPDECIDCLRCGHGDCRHDHGGPRTNSWCDVNGCDCSRLRTGDECDLCEGYGGFEDDREQWYECGSCGGEGYR